MKTISSIVVILLCMTVNAQSGKANTEKKMFSRTTSIEQQINATPETIWSILTNAPDYSNWNSTIVSIEGAISEGEKIRLKSTLDTSRTFKLKVKEFVPNERLVWGDGLGQRTYTIEKNGDGVLFKMSEKIGGFMFPLFANKIPSFDESFEAFVADLKNKAESAK